MKKIVTTIVMTILFVGCLALGVQLGLMNTRLHEDRLIQYHTEVRMKNNLSTQIVYVDSVKEPSVPFFFFRIFYNSYNRLKLRR